MVSTEEKECWSPDLIVLVVSVGDVCFMATVTDTPNKDHMTKSGSVLVPIQRSDPLVKVS